MATSTATQEDKATAMKEVSSCDNTFAVETAAAAKAEAATAQEVAAQTSSSVISTPSKKGGFATSKTLMIDDYSPTQTASLDSSSPERERTQLDHNGNNYNTSTTTMPDPQTPVAAERASSVSFTTPPSETANRSSSTINTFRSRVVTVAASPFQHLRRRRARSLDEHMMRRRKGKHHRHRIIEDHFCVQEIDPLNAKITDEANTDSSATNADGTNKKRKQVTVVLPGVPRHDPDWARDSHDFFNLVVLVPVVVLNVMCWNWEMILRLLHSSNENHHHDKHQALATDFPPFWLARAWTGEWFTAFFTVTALYFLVDLSWIILLPSCVKSPATIIQHHIATILYILIPYHCSEYQWCMGACMIVEINTWFLIARRVFNKQGLPPWTVLNLGSFVSIRVKLISIFFYTTWIGIRCLLYPYLMIPFYNNWLEYTANVGTRLNIVGLCVPLHAAFCLLNLKWSYDLLMSKIRYWRKCRQQQRSKGNRNNSNNDYQYVDKGL